MIKPRPNWLGMTGALCSCLLSGIIWYLFIVVLILVMRLAGANVSGIWPLKP